MESLGSLHLGKIAVAGVLAFAGLMTTGVGISNAATLQTEGTYPSRAACYAAGRASRPQRLGTGTISGVSRIMPPLARGAWF